jgi:hypothetical protein
VLVAASVSLVVFDLPTYFRWILVGAMILCAFGMVIIIVIMTVGIGVWSFRVMRFFCIPAERIAQLQDKWTRVEHLWTETSRHTRRTIAAATIAIIARVFTTLEAVLILSSLDIEPLVGMALLASAGSLVITWATPFIPYQASSAEGTAYLIFSMVGAAPHAGVVWELMRKIRRAVILCIGIWILGASSFKATLSGNH